LENITNQGRKDLGSLIKQAGNTTILMAGDKLQAEARRHEFAGEAAARRLRLLSAALRDPIPVTRDLLHPEYTATAHSVRRGKEPGELVTSDAGNEFRRPSGEANKNGTSGPAIHLACSDVRGVDAFGKSVTIKHNHGKLKLGTDGDPTSRAIVGDIYLACPAITGFAGGSGEALALARSQTRPILSPQDGFAPPVQPVETTSKTEDRGVDVPGTKRFLLPQEISSDLPALESRAAQGLPEAQYRVGFTYLFGINSKKDASKALWWLKSACLAGIAEACYDLAAAYFRGDGTDTDPVAAVTWLQVASEMGDADAQCALATAYLTGRGVIQNYRIAHMWARIAARSGHNRGAATLTQIEALMPTPQLSDAESSISSWTPSRIRQQTEFGYPRVHIPELFGPIGPLIPVAPHP
jgi:Sel1 repeat